MSFYIKSKRNIYRPLAFLRRQIWLLLPVRQSGQIAILLLLLYFLVLILVTCNFFSILPSADAIVEERYSILLALLTLQIPFLIFLFEITSRTLLSKKVVFEIYKIKGLFWGSILSVIAIILFPQAWLVLFVLILLILLSVRHFTIAYNLATRNRLPDELLEHQLYENVASVWEQKSIADCGASYIPVRRAVRPVREILEDIDQALYDAYKLPHTHEYAYWVDLLRTMGAAMDLQLNSNNNNALYPPGDQKSLIVQDVHDMYVRHFRYAWGKEDKEHFKFLLGDIMRELGLQFTTAGNIFRERGGVPRLNSVTIARHSSLLRECFLLLFDGCRFSKPDYPECNWLRDALLKSFKGYSQGLSGMIMWRLKPFQNIPALLDHCLGDLVYLSVLSLENKQEDVLKSITSNCKMFLDADVLQEIENDYGKEYAHRTVGVAIYVYRYIKDLYRTEQARVKLDLDAKYLNRCKSHIVEILDTVNRQTLTDAFLWLHNKTSPDYELTIHLHSLYDREDNSSEEMRHPKFPLTWLDFLVDGSHRINSSPKTYLAQHTKSSATFFQELQAVLQSDDILSQRFDALSEEDLKEIRKLVQALSIS